MGEGVTKAEADALIAQFVVGADDVRSLSSLIEKRLADALAIKFARDLPPAIRGVAGR
jgi:hypothetical protein